MFLLRLPSDPTVALMPISELGNPSVRARRMGHAVHAIPGLLRPQPDNHRLVVKATPGVPYVSDFRGDRLTVNSGTDSFA